MSYYDKYLKYKNKYLEIKKQFGGKIKWKYTHVFTNDRPLDQDLVEKEYQLWISLGKPDNYSNNEVSFPLYTYRGKTIMRTSDQASDVPVDEDCNSCKLRLASYKNNWQNGTYVEPKEIYGDYQDDDFKTFVIPNFIKDVKKFGGCIKCLARSKELIDKDPALALPPTLPPTPAYMLSQKTHYPPNQFVYIRGMAAGIAL